MRRISIGICALAASLCGAAPAAAGTLALEGETYVYTASPGQANMLYIRGNDMKPEELVIREGTELPIESWPAGCYREEWDKADTIRCPVRAGVRAHLGDGNDFGYVSDPLPAGHSVVVDGGPGDDQLNPPTGGSAVHFVGADGNDKLEGFDGADVLDGGPGNDVLDADDGNDQVYGGDGDDSLRGDGVQTGADLLDGGPGADKIEGDWTQTDRDDRAPISITLDGAANDGHDGEGDNVIAVERIKVTRAGTFVAGNEPIVFDIWNNGGSSNVKGSPGADDIRTWDQADTIDGGAGNDKIEAGNGSDTVTGGAGQDDINADAGTDSCNFLVCRFPGGNDVVHARDGERDSIDCGVGTDEAIVDAADVTSNCEKVDVGSGPGPSPGTTKGCKVPKVKRGTKPAAAKRKLRKAGCSAKTRKVRSKVKRGRVVKLAPKAGKRVKAGKTVLVYVSKGR